MADAKDYITKKEIPQLFECLMTGLMYHRPSDHVSYLQDCLEKIKKQGVQGVRWDLFLESKRAKTPLPPIAKTDLSREGSLAAIIKEDTQVSIPEEKSKPKLPPIQSDHTADVNHQKAVPKLIVPFTIPIINVIGGPGSGKKEVCQNMCERYGFSHVSIGEVLQKKIFAGKDTKTKWKVADERMQKGELAPDAVTISTVIKALNEINNPKGIVVEGFPRTMEQVDEWNKHIGRVDHIYLIDCEQDFLQERLLRRYHKTGKVEDQPGNIAKRINFFKNNTLPVCRYYDDQHKLVVQPIDADTDVDSMVTEVFKHFDQFFPALSTNRAPRPPSAPKPDKTRPVSGGKKVSDSEVPQSSPVTFIRKLEDIPVPSERQSGLPKCPIVFILGGPGSGRSMQAKKIAARYEGFVHISIADIAREKSLSTNADDTWQALTQLAHKGDLEQKIDIDLVKSTLIEKGMKANCILLEGFPTNESQLRTFYAEIGTPSLSILLDCEEYYMVNRLLSRGKAKGRIDDNMTAIGRRLQVFKDHTLPVVRHFDEAGKLCIILGDRDGDEVFYDIASLIDYCFFNQLPHHIQLQQDAAAEKIQAAFKGYMTRQEIANKTTSDDKPVEVEEVVEPTVSKKLGENENTIPKLDDNSNNADKLKECKVFFVIGGPGSGKGTLCGKLVTNFGFNHLSSGDLLRAEVESGSDLGKELSAIMTKGELVPMETVLRLLREAMIKAADVCDTFLIDGYPRELDQGKRFEADLVPCLGALVISVGEDVMMERLMKRGETSGRADDNKETIMKRFTTFNEVTKPVIDYYTENKKVRQLDGSLTPDEVYNKAIEVLKEFNYQPKHAEKEEPSKEEPKPEPQMTAEQIRYAKKKAKKEKLPRFAGGDYDTDEYSTD